jgi:hypothetical protein
VIVRDDKLETHKHIAVGESLLHAVCGTPTLRFVTLVDLRRNSTRTPPRLFLRTRNRSYQRILNLRHQGSGNGSSTSSRRWHIWLLVKCPSYQPRQTVLKHSYATRLRL